MGKMEIISLTKFFFFSINVSDDGTFFYLTGEKDNEGKFTSKYIAYTTRNMPAQKIY